jgi:hypothetical protein
MADVANKLVNFKSAVIPLTLPEHNWAALVIKNTPNDSLQVIYNNSSGRPLVEEKNYVLLMKIIAKINSDFHLTDIQYNSDAFTVDSLITLAIGEDTYKMSKVELQESLLLNEIDLIMANRPVIVGHHLNTEHLVNEILNEANQVNLQGESG